MVNFLEKINGFRKKGFVKNVATLQIGSFGGTTTQAVVGIFLARLLQPELFGIYSLAFGLASIASILLSSGSQEAVASILGEAYAKRDKEEILRVLSFFIKLILILIGATFLIILALPFVANTLYEDKFIGIYAIVIVIAVMLSSLSFSVTSLGLQVVGKIKTLTFLVFADQFLRYIFSLIFVVMGLSVFGAVSGHLVGAVAVFWLGVFLWGKILYDFSLMPTIRAIITRVRSVSIKKYLNFSVWVALDRNLSNLYLSLPVVLTGVYVVAEEVTFFKLAFGYLNLVLSLMGPISTLLNIEFPRMMVEDKIKTRLNFLKVSFYGCLMSLAMTAGAVLISPFFFKFIYGQAFVPSVKYIFGLFIYAGLYGIGVGLGPMWRAVNKVKTSILINLATLGVGIPVGLFLIREFNSWGAVVMVTAWYTVSHFVSFIYLARYLKKQF